MRNILYFHGLESFLSDKKKNILEKFGTVTANRYKYRIPEVLSGIIETFDDNQSDNTVLIGSSFGGYVAHMLSVGYNIPCLLFNPALVYRSIDESLDITIDQEKVNYSYIVLGRKDEVINCDANLQFINTHIKESKKVIIEENMQHGIPVDVFEKHVQLFLKKLEQNDA